MNLNIYSKFQKAKRLVHEFEFLIKISKSIEVSPLIWIFTHNFKRVKRLVNEFEYLLKISKE